MSSSSESEHGLSHLDADGATRMVEVGDKAITKRSATAQATMHLPDSAAAILDAGGTVAKGNVLETARLAAIMAAKKTSDIIPLCHPLPITGIDIGFAWENPRLLITATVRCRGQTGVEMEALTAASTAALTVYDMLKALSHDMVIGPIELLHKIGGKSGEINRTANTTEK